MKKIIGLIVLIILGGVGYMVYRVNASAIPSDPVLAYQKITGLPASDQAKAFQKAWTSWIQDPTSIIPYPKGWRKTSITVGKDTFDVITPDTTEPPQYYVSTAFPKKLIKKVTIARCLNLDPKKITDWCVVGDNPQVNAYFKMVEWVKKNSLLNGENLLGGISPQMNIKIPNTQ